MSHQSYRGYNVFTDYGGAIITQVLPVQRLVRHRRWMVLQEFHLAQLGRRATTYTEG